MELNKILELLKEPEKVIDPQQCNLLSSYLSGFITDFEETLNEQNYQVSVKHADLYEELKKISVADRQIELTDIYRAREKTKLILSQLRRLRGDLKDRFAVLTSIKRF